MNADTAVAHAVESEVKVSSARGMSPARRTALRLLKRPPRASGAREPAVITVLRTIVGLDAVVPLSVVPGVDGPVKVQ